MKHKAQRAVFLAVVLIFTGMLLILVVGLIREEEKNEKILQEIVSLNQLSYEEDFLREAKKLPGLLAISPVLEVPVCLKAGEYTMDTVFLGMDLEEYPLHPVQYREAAVGNTPVLLIGEKALSGLADWNGHPISQGEQEVLLTSLEQLELRYQLRFGDGTEQEDFLPLKTAAVLKEPEDLLILPYEQAERLLGENGQERMIKKVLLTVRGEKNFLKAKEILESF